MKSRTRVALTSLAAVFYAICYSAIKAGLSFAPPLRFAALRAALAGVTLLALVVVLRQPLLPPRRLWAGVCALGLVGTGVGFGAMFLSPERSSAGLASVLGNTTPLFVILLAALVLNDRVTRSKVIALVLGFIGTALISLPGAGRDGWSGLAGASIPLIAAAAVATESVLVKTLDLGASFLRVAAWQLLLGSLALLIASSWFEPNSVIEWSPTFLGLLALVAVPGTAVATSLWYRLVHGYDVGRLSLFLFMIPVLGLALGFLLFGERLGTVEMIGVALTLASVGWAIRDSARTLKAPANVPHARP